jgi:uncharacterized protein (TIGR02145 family)
MEVIMKSYIALFLGLAFVGSYISGCDSIVDEQQNGDVAFSSHEGVDLTVEMMGLTTEMCRNDPGWEVLGFKNLGQCLRAVQTNINPSPDRPTVTDIDGNEYQTVKIGEQWWMSENLRVTKHPNGDSIPDTVKSPGFWSLYRHSAYTIYSHDDVDGINSEAEMVDAYGILYNWYAVNDYRGLCPEGWHVPSDSEWTTLVNYLGGADIAGGQMKSTGTIQDGDGLWLSPNAGATNASGFSGLPGGKRNEVGYFSSIGEYGYWWSSTDSVSHAWYRSLSYDESNVVRSRFAEKSNGFSVRCVKD